MEQTKWPKLPKAFKTKWVKALRSGKFKQAKSTLLEIVKRTNEKGEYVEKSRGYCCLGVAACISGYTDKRLLPHSMLVHKKDWRRVPAPLREKKVRNKLSSHLADMNDSGDSFKVIANWIMKNL